MDAGHLRMDAKQTDTLGLTPPCPNPSQHHSCTRLEPWESMSYSQATEGKHGKRNKSKTQVCSGTISLTPTLCPPGSSPLKIGFLGPPSQCVALWTMQRYLAWNRGGSKNHGHCFPEASRKWTCQSPQGRLTPSNLGLRGQLIPSTLQSFCFEEQPLT